MLSVLAALSLSARLIPERLEWIDERVADLVDSPRYLDVFRDVSRLGSTGLTVGLAAVASLLVWNRCRPLAVLYPTAVIGGLIVNVALKVAVGRPRPPGALTGTALDSFPSGHTIQAVIALGMLPPAVHALTGRRAATLITTVIAAVGVIGVGVSPIVLAAHWPSDVVGGVLVGLLLLLAAELTLDRLPARWVPVCRDCPLHRAWGLASSAPHPKNS
jgi:membrane-associated phospholipid phosphatase